MHRIALFRGRSSTTGTRIGSDKTSQSADLSKQDHLGHNHSGHDHSGQDHSGHDHSGHDHSGHDRSCSGHGNDHSKHDHKKGHDHDHSKPPIEHVHPEQNHITHNHSENGHTSPLEKPISASVHSPQSVIPESLKVNQHQFHDSSCSHLDATESTPLIAMHSEVKPEGGVNHSHSH